MSKVSHLVHSHPSELSWSNLSVSTKATKKSPSKVILDNNQGVVRPGEFLAIMGPSGAGKTTLMNCLCSKYQQNLTITSGEILLNNIDIQKIDYKSMVGFVPQDDILIESLTVRETLDFSASLTLNVGRSERTEIVNNLIDELGLSGCADSNVGGVTTRGISGGEKKRVSIGVELIFNPSVLFLDEPTTGLDSFTALNIINLLSKLAKEKNSTIIATIHQPSSRIFSSFDRLLLLSFGNMIYMGKSKEAIEHFTALGYPIKPNYNPGDHFMDILCSENFKNTEYRENLRSEGLKTSVMNMINNEPKGHYHSSFLVSLYFLVIRDMRYILRNPLIIQGQILKTLLTVGLGSLTFANLGTDSFEIYDRYGALFMLSNNVIMDMLGTHLMIFQILKPIFVREYSVRKYSAPAFLCSFIITRLPIELISSLGNYAISYYIFKLNPRAFSFLLMNIVGFISAFTGGAFGLFISVVSPNMETASALSPLCFLPMVLSGGYIVSFNKIPDWFVLEYISVFRYSFGVTVRVDLEDNPDIDHDVSKSGVNSLHIPESLMEGIIYLTAIGVGLKLLSVLILTLISRKY